MKDSFIASFLSATTIVLAMASIAAGQTAASAPSPSNHTPVIVPKGTAFVAELAKSIDARKSKIGDAIKAKIVQDVLANGRILIHRGSKVIGHITTARASEQNGPKSVLGVVFDRMDLKGGEELSFHGVLIALAPPVEQPDVLSSFSTYSGANANGLQTVSHGSSSPIVDPREETDNTRRDALRNAADPTSYGTDNTLHNGFLGAGNRGVFGMKGMSLRPVPGEASTQLVSTRDDIKLESGTQMVVGVTASR